MKSSMKKRDRRPSRFEKLFSFLVDERRRRMKLMKRVGSLPKDKPNSFDLPRKPDAFGARDTEQNPTSKCLLHQNANHFTRKCRTFCSKSAEERAAIVRRTSGCHFCLSTEHVGKPCPWKEKWGPCKFTDCGKFHSHLLHYAKHKGLLRRKI